LGPSSGRFLACRISGLQHASSAHLLALPRGHAPPAGRCASPMTTPSCWPPWSPADRTYLTHSLRVGFERTGSCSHAGGLRLPSGHCGRMHLLGGSPPASPRVPATFLTILPPLATQLFPASPRLCSARFWMVTLYMFGRLLYRERQPLNTIGFAALCLLALSPRSLFDSSLQMTLARGSGHRRRCRSASPGHHPPLSDGYTRPRLIAIDAKLSPRTRPVPRHSTHARRCVARQRSESFANSIGLAHLSLHGAVSDRSFELVLSPVSSNWPWRYPWPSTSIASLSRAAG